MRPPSDHPKAPSLEALLKLKRAEKPDEQFWADFERGLRQRQLASIVEPKPWWLGLSLLARRSSPLMGGAAIGAVAVLAVLFARMDFTGNEPSSLALRNLPPARTEDTTATISPIQAGQGSSLVSNARSENLSLTLPKALTDSKPAEASTSAPLLAEAAPAPITSARQNQESAVESAAMHVPDFAPAHLHLAETTTAAIQSETAPPTPESGGWYTLAANPAVEDDETITASLPAANSRHERLLANVEDPDAVPSPKALANVRDRILHRMNDGEELYAAISRVGVRGDRLSLKF